jgi:hypothetical protein
VGSVKSKQDRKQAACKSKQMRGKRVECMKNKQYEEQAACGVVGMGGK